MFKDLFVNLTILISFVFAGGQVFKEKPLSHNHAIKTKILVGLAGGFLGITLIYFGIAVGTKHTILDFRYLAVLSVIKHAGFLPSLLTAVLMISFRLTFYTITPSSIYAVLSMIFMVVGSNLIWKTRAKQFTKWIFMNIYCVSIMSIVLYILLNVGNKAYGTIATFAITSLIVGMVQYYLLNYMSSINSLYRKFKEEAKKDSLTGLNNVRQFDEILNDLISKAIKNGEELSILGIDIDYFKLINDTYGHPVGDSVLNGLGKILISSCRSIDIVSRIGGEEFAILLPCCSYAQALEVAERVRKEVEKHKFRLPNNMQISITISIGVATYPDMVTNPDELVHKADEGLYLAKRSGRNRVCSVK
jgi:diguanylate cyclase